MYYFNTLSLCLGKTFVVVFPYALDFVIQVVLEDMIFLAFNIPQILHFLESVEFSKKSTLISCSRRSIPNTSVFIGYICVGDSIGFNGIL